MTPTMVRERINVKRIACAASTNIGAWSEREDDAGAGRLKMLTLRVWLRDVGVISGCGYLGKSGDRYENCC